MAQWVVCKHWNGPQNIANKINSVIPIASSYRHSAQNIAFHEIGRQAIMADPNWKKVITIQKKFS